MGIYTDAATVLAEDDVDDTTTVGAVDRAIDAAEDQIDEWLGVWPVQTTGPSAGRKIVEADVDAWRWTKLQRAATRLAAHLVNDPTVLSGPEWSNVSGPDFSRSGPAPTMRKISDVVAPLNASGLRLLGGRASA